MSHYDVVVRELYVPPLHELARVLQSALEKNFRHASVQVVDCPNLKEPPYSLAAPGFGGKAAVLDVGGVLNMEFLQNNNKYHFDLQNISSTSSLPFFIGAGATKPSVSVSKDNSEWMPNAHIKTGVSLSKEAYVDKKTGKCVLASYPSYEFSSLCNLFGTEGLPHTKVLKIETKERIGKLNFPACIRQALASQYPKQQVGLGGAFIASNGKFKSHVMPGFPPCDVFGSDKQWLTYYEVDGPLTCLSVLLNIDLHNDEARLEHTHFFTTHTEGGHYHYDTTPETVHYDGYYAPAHKFYRIGKATKPANKASL